MPLTERAMAEVHEKLIKNVNSSRMQAQLLQTHMDMLDMLL